MSSKQIRSASTVGWKAWRASWGRSYRLMRRNGFERSDRPVQPERPARREETRCSSTRTRRVLTSSWLWSLMHVRQACARVALRFGISGGAIRVRFDKGVDQLIFRCAQGNKGRPSWMTQGVTWSSGKSRGVGLKVEIDPNYLEVNKRWG